MWEHRKSISETDGRSARFTQRRKRGDWLERWQGRVTTRLEADPGLRCQGVSRLPLSSDGSRANALLELAPCSQLPRWMVWLGPRFSSGPRRSSFCENYLLDLSPHSLRQHTDAPLQFPPLALLPHSPLCPATNAAVRTERWGTARPHWPGKAPEARIPIAASLRTARASWASRFWGGEQLCSERRALATSSKGQGPDGGGGHGGQLRGPPSPPGAGRGFAIVFGNFWNIRNTPLDIWIDAEPSRTGLRLRVAGRVAGRVPCLRLRGCLCPPRNARSSFFAPYRTSPRVIVNVVMCLTPLI